MNFRHDRRRFRTAMARRWSAALMLASTVALAGYWLIAGMDHDGRASQVRFIPDGSRQARSVPGGDEKPSVGIGRAGRLSSVRAVRTSAEFRAEWAALAGAGDVRQREIGLRRLCEAADLAALQELFMEEQVSSGLGDDVIQAVLRRLTRDDADWVGRYLRDLPEGSRRQELIGKIMRHMGENDLPAAVEWATSLEDASLRQGALLHLSYQWFAADQDRALAYATVYAHENRQLLANFVGLWSRDEPDTAAAWAVEKLPPAIRDELVPALVSGWAGRDNTAAADFVAALPQGKMRQQAAISVMAELARNDPAAGARWAGMFATGPNKDYAIENLAYGWVAKDPVAARAWAGNLTAAERDTALFAGAGRLMEHDPAQAAAWVMDIRDETRRNHQAERVARQWLVADRWAASAWIARSTLPEATKQRLLGGAPGHR